MIYILVYTFSDMSDHSGVYWTYSEQDAREFVQRNKPDPWVLYQGDRQALDSSDPTNASKLNTARLAEIDKGS